MTAFDTANGYAESGGRDLGYHNLARSTAAGRYGITDTTWGGLMRNYPDLGLSWDNRLDPSANQRAHSALTTENTNTLRRNGVANPTTADLGLASFLGPAGATAMLTARPDEAAVDVLTRAVGRDQAQRMLAANPGVLDPSKRVSDILSWNSARLGGPAHSAGGDGGGDAPQQPSGGLGGPYQATPLPPMPEDFGRPSAPAPGAVAVDRTGRTGDPLIALGMGLMSGGDWRTGMANGLQAYQHAQDQLGTDQRANATLANAAAERDFKNPAQAAEVSKLRAEAWAKMNPTISPTDAMNANVHLATNATTVDMQRQAMEAAERRHEADLALRREQFDQGQKVGERFIAPNSDGKDEVWLQTNDTKGNTTFKNLQTGETSATLPEFAQSEKSRNVMEAQSNGRMKMAIKEVAALNGASTAARTTIESINEAEKSFLAPDARTGPGFAQSAWRKIASLAGYSMTEQDEAGMRVGSLNSEAVRSIAHGLGPMSDADREMWTKNMPTIGTDPEAAKRIFGVMRRANERKVALGEAWNALPTAQKMELQRSGTISGWVDQTTKKMFEGEAPKAPPAPTGAPGSQSNPVDLNRFLKP